LAEANFVLHAWLRSGNTDAGQGAVQFLREAFVCWMANIVSAVYGPIRVSTPISF
jgi:hypothetical protein